MPDYNPNTLVDLARCFRCLGSGMQGPVQIMLMARWAGCIWPVPTPPTPNVGHVPPQLSDFSASFIGDTLQVVVNVTPPNGLAGFQIWFAPHGTTQWNEDFNVAPGTYSNTSPGFSGSQYDVKIGWANSINDILASTDFSPVVTITSPYPCGTPSNTIHIIGPAGVPGVVQNYTYAGASYNGKNVYVSQDGLKCIAWGFSPDGWIITNYPIAFRPVADYSSDISVFPCAWTNPFALPEPTGQYIP